MIEMFQNFFENWDLFRDASLVGWCLSILLAQVGVLVVARDQVFIGAAISQASALGIALALACAAWFAPEVVEHVEFDPFAFEEHPEVHVEEDDQYASFFAVAFSVLAALLTAGGGYRSRRESREAVTGWIFLFCASVSILIVSHSDHGTEEVHRLLFSSLIGADSGDVWIFGFGALISVVAFSTLRRRLVLVTLDPEMAAAVGMRSRVWSFAIAVWLGLAIGLSMRVSGLLFTFGLLVLPTLVVKSLHRSTMPMLFTAPLVGLVASFFGSIIADHYDFPAAQMTVALLSGLVAVSWLIGAIRGRSAGA